MLARITVIQSLTGLEDLFSSLWDNIFTQNFCEVRNSHVEGSASHLDSSLWGRRLYEALCVLRPAGLRWTRVADYGPAFPSCLQAFQDGAGLTGRFSPQCTVTCKSLPLRWENALFVSQWEYKDKGLSSGFIPHSWTWRVTWFLPTWDSYLIQQKRGSLVGNREQLHFTFLLLTVSGIISGISRVNALPWYQTCISAQTKKQLSSPDPSILSRLGNWVLSLVMPSCPERTFPLILLVVEVTCPLCNLELNSSDNYHNEGPLSAQGSRIWFLLIRCNEKK